MAARFEALEAKLQAEEKVLRLRESTTKKETQAATTRFEAIEAKVSDTSLTHRIEELVHLILLKQSLNSLSY